MDSKTIRQILALLNTGWCVTLLGKRVPTMLRQHVDALFCAIGPRSTDLMDEKLRAAIYPEMVEGFMMRGVAFELVRVNGKET